jgi:hypothetical protein
MNEPLDLPTPNLPLLRKVLDHIDAHPEEWHQANMGDEDDLKCGTPMCVAGWALAFTGCQSQHWTAWRAASALGLTDDEADDLFFNTLCPHEFGLDLSDTRGAVQLVAERIAARAGERL